MTKALVWRGAALLGACALILVGCRAPISGPRPHPRPTSTAPSTEAAPPTATTPPTDEESARASVALAPTDVLTIQLPSTDPGGSYGDVRYEITEDSLSSSFTMFDGTTIYVATTALTTSQRDALERSAETYVDTDPAERGPKCPHSGRATVTISGSVVHRSEAYPCFSFSPMNALLDAVGAASSEVMGQLAEPYEMWSIEIRPWATDGPDESAPVERYTLDGFELSGNMAIEGENTPPGWGRTLLPVPAGDEPMIYEHTTATVLTALNDVILGEERAHCEEPSAEVRIILHDSPDLVRTTRLCPGQEPEVLVDALRGL